MKISSIDLGGLRFPGRAGRLQEVGATAALVRELGDNYETYNAFLAEEMRKLGGDPDPADYVDDYDGFIQAAARIRDVTAAEIALRRCDAHRTRGQALDAEPAGTPIIDSGQRIVSIKTGTAALQYTPSRRAREWKSPPPPDVAPAK